MIDDTQGAGPPGPGVQGWILHKDHVLVPYGRDMILFEVNQASLTVYRDRLISEFGLTEIETLVLTYIDEMITQDHLAIRLKLDKETLRRTIHRICGKVRCPKKQSALAHWAGRHRFDLFKRRNH